MDFKDLFALYERNLDHNSYFIVPEDSCSTDHIIKYRSFNGLTTNNTMPAML